MEADLVSMIRERLQSASFSFELLGAVIFGSYAAGKATNQSDLDLLVVGSGLRQKRQHRTAQIGELKRILPEVPLDVSLVTPEEASSNFSNHNPLFLDIAEDGVLLIDKEGLLARMIEETRRYVRARGITRMEGGWRFPVKAGAATYLSRVSNQDFARGMMNDAGRDLSIGNQLLESAYYDKAVYHFQQSVEKGAKAVLIAFGVFQKSHVVGKALRDILRELRVPEKWRESLARLATISEDLEPEHSLSRYPGIVNDTLWIPSEEYSREDAESAASRAKAAVDIAQLFLVDWFGQT